MRQPINPACMSPVLPGLHTWWHGAYQRCGGTEPEVQRARRREEELLARARRVLDGLARSPFALLSRAHCSTLRCPHRAIAWQTAVAIFASAPRLGFGRIVASEIEVQILFVNLV